MVESLPVRRLVLYKHGVGFVERSGEFQGEKLALEFQRADMDDVLKSLLVADRGGGKVVGISYDGAEDVQEKVQKKALVPPEKEALVGLLRKLSGYRLRARTTSSQVEGVVAGTDETEMISVGETALPNPKVLLREADGALVPVPLRELVNIELLDGEPSADLQYFLRLVTAERKRDRRALTVYLEGKTHDLRVSYLTSAPSWRVTYRLDHRPQETFLQAWGVVDNWLEEDLNDVRVSLVAGKPISFVYDVYVPRTVPRPVVREEVRALDSPVELEGGVEKLDDMSSLADEERSNAFGGASMGALAEQAKKPAPPSMRARSAMAMPMSAPAPAPPEPSVGGSARVQTRQVEGGEFFRYDVENPLTVLRGQSAMVPIVQEPIKVHRELVYNPEKVPGNPVAVLRWKNESGVLERGPTVVLEEGTYAGEGILPYTTREGEVKVAFAVDLGVQVGQEVERSTRTVGLQIDRTFARREQKQKRTTKYSIENRKTDAVDLVVEHPREAGWSLLEGARPEEETGDLRRFRLALKGTTKSTLTVAEERVDWVAQAMQSFGAPMLESLVGEASLGGPVLQHVRALLEVYKEKSRLERNVQKLQQTRNTLNNEQNRVRVNLATVQSTQNKTLQQKYTEQLQALEQRLVDLLSEEDRNQSGISELEKKADQLIDTWPAPPSKT